MAPPRVRSRLATPERRRRRIRAVLSRIRATRHHALALLREFRLPLTGFVLVTVVGGFVYGELYRIARGTVIPYIDRPYVMVQLMVLETPESVPPEWYLVIFWYALPAAFVILLGLGATDFVDLFFNRDENRDAWGEAVAMTYSNHVIVMGAGHVGLRVVRDLVEMGLEVVVIDHDPSPEVRDALGAMSVPLIMGDGRQGEVQAKAGLPDAEAFVACTSDDHVNLESVMKARDSNPDARVVVRMWDRTFAAQMQRFLSCEAVLNAADLSAPAFAGAAAGIDITQTLEVGGVEYSTVRLTARPGSFLDGAQVGDLESQNGMEIVLVGRGENARVDPERELAVKAGDDLVIFARHERILEFVARNRRGK